jgi:uncharacterized protein
VDNKPQSFLARPSILGVNNALAILLVVFFLLPFALRGGRMSLQKTENNVKEWLPSDFRETSELQWFSNYFIGERFILATWPTASEDDQRLSLFRSKLLRESTSDVGNQDKPADWQRARQLGEELRLLAPADEFTNWGNANERWIVSESGVWYFILPNGHLFRWDGKSDMVGGIVRSVQRMFSDKPVTGQFVAALGQASDINPFYNEPRLLCAALIKGIQTGPEVAAELAREGGPLWPIDTTAPEYRSVLAKRLAMDRLTGTLFAPAIPADFAWTPAAFASQLPAIESQGIPKEWDARVEKALESVCEQRFGGNRDALLQASPDKQSDAYYAVLDELEIPAPPRQTAVLITLTDRGSKNLHYVCGRGMMGQARGRILTIAEESGIGVPPNPSPLPPPLDRLATAPVITEPLLRLGGPPVDNVAIDEEGTITLFRLVGYSILLGLVLSYYCLRSGKLMIMVFFVGGSCAAMSLALVWWSGDKVDAILLSMPSLIYVLGLSGAIHFVSYYREEVQKRGVAGAAERAVRVGLKPSILCSITTAIGLISLFTSNIVPIRKYGWYSAIATIATLSVLFTYLPAALHIFAPKLGKANEGKRKSIWDRSEDFFQWISTQLTRRHAIVTVIGLSAMVIFGYGCFQLRTSVHLLKMFDHRSQIIQDYSWLESNFGRLVPMELVLRVPPHMQRERFSGANADEGVEPTDIAVTASPSTTDHDPRLALNLLERLEAVDRIQTVVERVFGQQGTQVAGRSMSAVTFLPQLPEPSNNYSPVRAKFNRELNAGRQDLLRSDYVRSEREGPYRDSELYRVSMRLGALTDVDYGMFVNQVRMAVEPVLEAYRCREEVLQKVAKNRALEDAVAENGHGNESAASNRPFGRVLVLGLSAPKPLRQTPVLAPPHAAAPSHAAVPAAKPTAAGFGDPLALAGQTTETAAATEPTTDVDATASGDPLHRTIEQTNIFAATLGELLANAPLRATSWHAPETLQGRGKDPRWGKQLQAFDCVVILRDHPEYDMDFIRSHVRQVVDFRVHDGSQAEPLIRSGIPDVSAQRPLQVIYTGVVPVVYKAQRTLLNSLIDSNIWAFLMIAATMAIVMNPGSLPLRFFHPRSQFFGWTSGMVAMLPNVFPVILIFGAMGFMNMEVDIGSMMTAAVAMGIAVDDTIHFLSSFRKDLAKGMPRHAAIINTYKHVAPAMVQTSIVAGLGLFVFALSTFTPTQRFGTLMLVILAAAVLGDLVLLPALLAGPLGRFFRPPENYKHEDESAQQPPIDDQGSNPTIDIPPAAPSSIAAIIDAVPTTLSTPSTASQPASAPPASPAGAANPAATPPAVPPTDPASPVRRPHFNDPVRGSRSASRRPQ